MLFVSSDSPNAIRQSLKEKGFNPQRIKYISNIKKKEDFIRALNTEYKVGADYLFSLEKVQKKINGNIKIITRIKKENRGIIILDYNSPKPKNLTISPKVDFYLSSLSNGNLKDWIKTDINNVNNTTSFKHPINLYNVENLKCKKEFRRLLTNKVIDVEAYQWMIKRFKDFPSKFDLECDKIVSIHQQISKPLNLDIIRVLYGTSSNNIYSFLNLLFKFKTTISEINKAFDSLSKSEKWILFVSSKKNESSLLSKHFLKNYPLLYNYSIRLAQLIKCGASHIDFSPLRFCQVIQDQQFYKLKILDSKSLALIDYCINF